METNRILTSDERHDSQEYRGNGLLAQNNEDQERIVQFALTVPGQPRTTKAESKIQRTILTTDMNRIVMRCYYRATQLEQITTGYRFELQKLFSTPYPQLVGVITEQRIIDQKRVII